MQPTRHTTNTAMATEQTVGPNHGRFRRWDEAEANDVMFMDTDGTSEQPSVAAFIVQFEATAQEDLRVGLGAVVPTESDETTTKAKVSWRYEIVIGGTGNTEVIVRKNATPIAQKGAKEVELNRAFTGRTCSRSDFIPYWVAMSGNYIAVGIGSDVGEDPLAVCCDSEAQDAVEQLSRASITTWDTPVTYRNLRVKSLMKDENGNLPVVDASTLTPRVIVREEPTGSSDLLTPEQHNSYKEAVETARRRFERFGASEASTFIPPSVKEFVDPKLIRQLQRSGRTQPGFVTGFDMTSEEEKKKRAQRMERFQTPSFAVDFSTETAQAMRDGMSQEEWQEMQSSKEKMAERAVKFGLSAEETRVGGKAELGQVELTPASEKVKGERMDVKENMEARTDALHLYSPDSHFQRVRTKDVLSYFEGYGPSYVEWLNDSSCTVVFEDPFTAGRALIALSQPIEPQTRKKVDESDVKPEAEDVEMGDAEEPTEGDNAMEEEVPDDAFNRSGWHWAFPIASSGASDAGKWRLLLRKATDDDFPPEKANKKYHERGSRGRRDRAAPRQQGGRNALESGDTMPSRYGSDAKPRRRGERSHPYRRDQSRRSRGRKRDE